MPLLKTSMFKDVPWVLMTALGIVTVLPSEIKDEFILTTRFGDSVGFTGFVGPFAWLKEFKANKPRRLLESPELGALHVIKNKNVRKKSFEWICNVLDCFTEPELFLISLSQGNQRKICE